MDKEQLKQLRYIKSEIEVIKDQIADIEPVMATDKVTGSSAYFPYTQRSFTLEGIDYDDYHRRVRRLQNKLDKRRKELLELQESANDFIAGIEDSLVRQAIMLRYVEGLSWQKVANKMGNNSTADGLRMAVNRYLND